MPQHVKLKRRLLAVVILLLAFALRIVAISHIPPGLSHDEAYNGVTALQLLDGQHRIFFEINKGIEPLIIYLEALAFYAFGVGPVQLRLVNIFCGMLTVALVYPLATRLFNHRIALLAMAGLALSFWAVFVSRLTLRAAIFPPLLILTLYFLWRGLTGPAPLRFFALSGLAAGASMYTYLSSRFVPLLVIVIFGYQLIRRQINRQHWLGLLIHLAIWAALLSPLAGYFWQNAASFSERSSQVSTLPYLLNGEFGPTIHSTLRTLGMFTFHGDDTDRYNLDGRPVFDWLNGLFFYLGLGLLLVRLRRPPSLAGPAALLLLWLFCMLLPDFITDDSPHFLRTIGALPAVYLTWAVGLAWLLQRLPNQLACALRSPFPALRSPLFAPRSPLFALRSSLSAPRSPLIPALLLSLLLLFTTIHTAYDYFIRWASAPQARSIYGADIAEIATYLKNAKSDDLVAISAEYYQDLDPFRFTLHFQGQPPWVIWFDGRQTLAIPPPASGLSPRYLFAASAPAAPEWLPLLQAVPGGSGAAYTLYRLAAGAGQPPLQPPQLSPENRLNVNINGDLVVSGYEVLGSVITGGKFLVLLGWQPLRPLPPGTDYTFLARLRDRQGHLWAEADGLGLPPVYWQPGVQAWQLLTFRLPGDLPPRVYQLTVELVNRNNGRALPAITGETVVPLTTLTVQLAHTPRLIDPARLPNPIPAALAQSGSTDLALRGYRLDKQVVTPGDVLVVTLHWQVHQQPQQDYRLHFYLTPENDAGMPLYQWPLLDPIGGEWPTSHWPTGYWVQDKVNLPVAIAIPPGRYKLGVALVAAAAGPLPSNRSEAVGSSHFALDSITVVD